MHIVNIRNIGLQKLIRNLDQQEMASVTGLCRMNDIGIDNDKIICRQGIGLLFHVNDRFTLQNIDDLDTVMPVHRYEEIMVCATGVSHIDILIQFDCFIGCSRTAHGAPPYVSGNFISNNGYN